MKQQKCEKVTYTITKEIRDADGMAIFPGSVLKSIEDGATGVVVKILKEGDRGPWISCVGDMIVQLDFGHQRISSKYDKWRHVHHDDQTYRQRLLSWKLKPYRHDSELREVSEEEGKAIDGIMALLPTNTVDWDNWDGPWPDTIEDTLEILAIHLANVDDDNEKK